MAVVKVVPVAESSIAANPIMPYQPRFVKNCRFKNLSRFANQFSFRESWSDRGAVDSVGGVIDDFIVISSVAIALTNTVSHPTKLTFGL